MWEIDHTVYLLELNSVTGGRSNQLVLVTRSSVAYADRKISRVSVSKTLQNFTIENIPLHFLQNYTNQIISLHKTSSHMYKIGLQLAKLYYTHTQTLNLCFFFCFFFLQIHIFRYVHEFITCTQNVIHSCRLWYYLWTSFHKLNI